MNGVLIELVGIIPTGERKEKRKKEGS